MYIKENTDEGAIQVNPSTTFQKLGMTESSDESMYMMGNSMDVWAEMMDNDELLKSQYDVISGKWPEKYNEVMLIVNENNEISDYTFIFIRNKNQNELTEKCIKLWQVSKLKNCKMKVIVVKIL